MTPENYISSFNLNHIHVRRASLTAEDAILVWHLKRRFGEYDHIIAAQFGTNAGRISDVLTEKTHIGSREKAFLFFSG